MCRPGARSPGTEAAARRDRAEPGQQRVCLLERYEVQILDSHGVEKLASNEAGVPYQKKAADLNASTARETWQTRHHVPRGPLRRGRQEDVRRQGHGGVERQEGPRQRDGRRPDGRGRPASAAAGTIRLQDHGNKGRFREVWVEPLS
ncbi:family 16 glycoside hydrolase [Streptomyces aureus]|uniref:Family 16 glycoside hydrolase n=1 Tax=Streptomyces aureus TaxID=193461 RepID=A0ABV4SDK4_9ACTN